VIDCWTLQKHSLQGHVARSCSKNNSVTVPFRRHLQIHFLHLSLIPEAAAGHCIPLNAFVCMPGCCSSALYSHAVPSRGRSSRTEPCTETIAAPGRQTTPLWSCKHYSEASWGTSEAESSLVPKAGPQKFGAQFCLTPRILPFVGCGSMVQVVQADEGEGYTHCTIDWHCQQVQKPQDYRGRLKASAASKAAHPGGRAHRVWCKIPQKLRLTRLPPGNFILNLK
jgi:hypothetical protein